MSNKKNLKNLIAKLKKEVEAKPILFAQLADYYLQLEQPKPAAELLATGLEQFPNYATAWVIKGNLHLQLKQPEEALASFNYALEMNSNLSYAHERCCKLTEDTDRPEYIQHLRELQRIDPLSGNTQKMLEVAILRQAAVEHELYSEKEVLRIMPSMLRKELYSEGYLPPELDERHQSMSVSSETNELPPLTTGQIYPLDSQDDEIDIEPEDIIQIDQDSGEQQLDQQDDQLLYDEEIDFEPEYDQPLVQEAGEQQLDEQDDQLLYDEEIEFEPEYDQPLEQEVGEQQLDQQDDQLLYDEEIDFEPECDQPLVQEAGEQQLDEQDDQLLYEEEIEFKPEYDQPLEQEVGEQQLEQQDDQLLYDEEIEFEPEYDQPLEQEVGEQQLDQQDDQLLYDEEIDFEPEYDQPLEQEAGEQQFEQQDDQLLNDEEIDFEPEYAVQEDPETDVPLFGQGVGGYEQQEYPEELSDDLEYGEHLDQDAMQQYSLESDLLNQPFDNTSADSTRLQEVAEPEPLPVKQPLSSFLWDSIIDNPSSNQDSQIDEQNDHLNGYSDEQVLGPSIDESNDSNHFILDPKPEPQESLENQMWNNLSQSKPRQLNQDKLDLFLREPPEATNKPTLEESIDWDSLEKPKPKSQSGGIDHFFNEIKEQPAWDSLDNLSKPKQDKLSTQPDQHVLSTWSERDVLAKPTQEPMTNKPDPADILSWDSLDVLAKPTQDPLKEKPDPTDVSSWDSLDVLGKPTQEPLKEKPDPTDVSSWDSLDELGKPTQEPMTDKPDSTDVSSWDSLDNLSESKPIESVEQETQADQQKSSFWVDFNNLTKPTSEPVTKESFKADQQPIELAQAKPSSWANLDRLENQPPEINQDEIQFSDDFDEIESQPIADTELEKFLLEPPVKITNKSEDIVGDRDPQAYQTPQTEEKDSDIISTEGMKWLDDPDQLMNFASLDDGVPGQPPDSSQSVISLDDDEIILPVSDSNESDEYELPTETDEEIDLPNFVSDDDDDDAYKPQSNHAYSDDSDDDDKDEEESAPTHSVREQTASKTLAEMYASQGEWSRAVEVYEQLLIRQPDNGIYIKRLEALKRKLSR